MREPRKMGTEESCVWVLVAIALIIPIVMWHAFVLKLLYGWFIVSQFGWHEISFGQMCGLFVLIATLRMRWTPRDDDEGQRWNRLAFAVIAPAYLLGVGAIVRWIFL